MSMLQEKKENVLVQNNFSYFYNTIMLDKKMRHQRRNSKVKESISLGTPERPRIVVSRTNTKMDIQVIDDIRRVTLIGTDTRGIKSGKDETPTHVAEKLGVMVAEKLLAMKIDAAVFDRNGFLYHGRVKAVCEGLRKGGVRI